MTFVSAIAITNGHKSGSTNIYDNSIQERITLNSMYKNMNKHLVTTTGRVQTGTQGTNKYRSIMYTIQISYRAKTHIPIQITKLHQYW